ncbi:hypothetical protein SCOCK_160152 [Actinacidiphila cocklensis]|uniref:Uncharacterized protein n=1 Tax=Actinacidiphila cocklensis TaxID=887465 RepID=A0A9W4GQ71_9ACTN|nr:hypothetical protein SCOCK_160152 [Actinacidiphila cocklensis]
MAAGGSGGGADGRGALTVQRGDSAATESLVPAATALAGWRRRRTTGRAPDRTARSVDP